MSQFSTCLWFDDQAEAAAKFYSSIFKNSKIKGTSYYTDSAEKVSGKKAGSVMVVDLRIEDLEIQALNGGPMFKFSPALSFFLSCENEAEIDERWRQLSDGGKVRMALDKYPWAPKYGWTTDRFGVEWQLILAPRKQKLVPAFLFVDSLFGKGQEALDFYLSVFPNSKIESISKDEKTKAILHAAFELDGQGFVLMEGPGTHEHGFTHATSITVNCDTQKEIDHYWEKLSVGGSTEQCGWLRDKYGVSWQIVPNVLAKLMSNPKTAAPAMDAMLRMKKLDIAGLERAVL